MKRIALTLTAVTALAGASPALAQTPLEWLNSVRADIGAPALGTDATAMAGCQAHAQYMATHMTLTHTQIPGAPGASPLGAEWGQRGNLSNRSEQWFAGAPYHLAGLIEPYAVRMGQGVARSASGIPYWCVATTYEWLRPSPWRADDILVWPRPGSTVTPAYQTSELPSSPTEDVGLPRGTVTGPQMILFPVGPARERDSLLGGSSGAQCLHVERAVMTGPAGGVEVRAIDSARNPHGDACHTGWVYLVPVAPLAPETTYTVEATVRSAPHGAPEQAVRVSRTWTYRTAAAPPETCDPLIAPCPTTETPHTKPGPHAGTRAPTLKSLRLVRRASTLRVGVRASHKGRLTIRIVRPSRPATTVRLVRKGVARPGAAVKATTRIPADGRLRVRLTLDATNGRSVTLVRTI